MIGPLSKLLCEGCHVSPIMSRLKDDSERRAIIDLLYEGEQSVNGCTPRGVYDERVYLLVFTIIGLSYTGYTGQP